MSSFHICQVYLNLGNSGLDRGKLIDAVLRVKISRKCEIKFANYLEICRHLGFRRVLNIS